MHGGQKRVNRNTCSPLNKGASEVFAGCSKGTTEGVPTVQPSLRDFVKKNVIPGTEQSAQCKSCTAERVPPGYIGHPCGITKKQISPYRFDHAIMWCHVKVLRCFRWNGLVVCGHDT
jgi:hypothetical protein